MPPRDGILRTPPQDERFNFSLLLLACIFYNKDLCIPWLRKREGKRMTQGYFITGTDTNVGKTFYAVRLLHNLRTQGFSTAALKPIASGCKLTVDGLRNEDALALQQAVTLKLPYSAINPFAFSDPIAPHIAAEKSNEIVTVKKLMRACDSVLQSSADYIVVEGAGGWLVPLNATETMADFAKALNFPVILVVGIQLGCLNHALLTWKNLQQSHIEVAGWVANQIDPDMQYSEENIATLQQRLSVPLLEVIKYKKSSSYQLATRTRKKKTNRNQQNSLD